MKGEQGDEMDSELEQFLEATEPSGDAVRDRDEAQAYAQTAHDCVLTLAFAASAHPVLKTAIEGGLGEVTSATKARIASMNRRAQVAEFMRAFRQPIAVRPTIEILDDLVRLRMRLVAEEFFELLDATFDARKGTSEFARLHEAASLIESVIEDGNVLVDIAQLADACADLDYVVEGLRLTFGIDGAPIAAIVHASNMAKVGGKMRTDGKLQKPEGWQAPDILGELRRQGFLVEKPCPLCRGTGKTTEVDAIEANGTLVNPRPSDCFCVGETA